MSAYITVRVVFLCKTAFVAPILIDTCSALMCAAQTGDQTVSQSLSCAERHPDRMIGPSSLLITLLAPSLTGMPQATGLMAVSARISSKSDS